MGVDKITVHDNSAVAAVKKSGEKLEAKIDALQTDVTQIKKDVKPTAIP